MHGRVLSTVTPDWERFDLAFLTPAEFARQDGAALRPLLDDASRPAASPPGADAGAAERLERLACEFIRVLGLAPVAIGRGEWIVARQGLELLRNMLVELMLEENGVPPGARGAKRLNPFLDDEQRRLLEALPSPGAERSALLAAQGELARAFLLRGRPLATRLGAAWPEAFEVATRNHLRRALALTI